MTSPVQSVGHANGNGTGTSFVTTIAATGAAHGMVVLLQLDGGGTCSNVTNSKGDAFTQVSVETGAESVYGFYCPSCTAGATTVTATVSNNAVGTMVVIEEPYSFVAVDKFLGNLISGASWTIGPMGATAQANDTLYCAISHGSLANGFGSSGAWAGVTGTGLTSGLCQNTTNGEEMFVERQEVSATGAYSGTGVSTSGGTYIALVFALKQGATQINVAQETASTGSSGTSVALAYVSNVKAGSGLHCFVRWQTAATGTVSDNLNGAWTPRGPVINDGGSGHLWQQYTLDNSLAGACTVTWTPNVSATFVNMAIREIANTSGYDVDAEQVQAGFGSTTTDAVTTGSMTPSVQPGLVSSLVNFTVNNPPVPAAGTGYTLDANPWGATNSLTQHQRYTSLAPLAATATASAATSTNAASLAACWKETGATQVVPPQIFMHRRYVPIIESR